MTPKIAFCCALFLMVLALPSGTLAQASKDNPTVTALFSMAKTAATKIKMDASDMESYSRATGLSWQSHDVRLNAMKTDINELSKVIEGLKSQRSTASEWQQNAIDRVTPLMSDLVESMNTTINHIGQSKARPTRPPYPEYLHANARIAADLSSEVNDIVEYAQEKDRMDRLAPELDKS